MTTDLIVPDSKEIVSIGPYKDWDHIAKALESNKLSTIELGWAISDHYSMEESFRRTEEQRKANDLSIAKRNGIATLVEGGLAAAAGLSTIGGVLVGGIAILTGARSMYKLVQHFCIESIIVEEPEKAKNAYSADILEKANFRYSTVRDLQWMHNGYYFSLEREINLLGDLNLLRSEKFKNKSVIVRGKISGKAKTDYESVYFFENDHGSVHFYLLGLELKAKTDNLPHFKNVPYNVSGGITSRTSTSQLSAYLDACNNDRRTMYVGGYVRDNSNFIADLFRDENGNGFDVCVKKD